jgi:hypothetical protein
LVAGELQHRAAKKRYRVERAFNAIKLLGKDLATRYGKGHTHPAASIPYYLAYVLSVKQNNSEPTSGLEPLTPAPDTS